MSWIGAEAKALLNQSLHSSKNVNITARSGDAVRAVATAAASGGDKGKKDEKGGGSADKQADKVMGSAGGIAEKFGGMDGAKIQNSTKGRQKAETAENSVAGAGAFILNVQSNKARAEIMDGVNIDITGNLNVQAYNRTDATVKANASSTKSDTGVGVGVALNIVTMENIARIGTGSVTAGDLTLTALIAKEPTKVRKVTIAEDASNFKTQMNETIVNAIKEMLGDDYDKVDWLVESDSAFITTFYDKLVRI